MPNISKKIDSPCVKICKYDDNFMNGMVCIGCFREQHEITNWLRMSEKEKNWLILILKIEKWNLKNE